MRINDWYGEGRTEIGGGVQIKSIDWLSVTGAIAYRPAHFKGTLSG